MEFSASRRICWYLVTISTYFEKITFKKNVIALHEFVTEKKIYIFVLHFIIETFKTHGERICPFLSKNCQILPPLILSLLGPALLKEKIAKIVIYYQARENAGVLTLVYNIDYKNKTVEYKDDI